MKIKSFIFLISILLFSCLDSKEREVTGQNNFMNEIETLELKNNYQKVILAGGCFWCVESTFEKHEGIISATSGYAGGDIENPTYKLVSSGKTKHIEAVLVVFNPTIISYEKVLDIFWKEIDPTDDEGQFVDRGFQYTTAIFYFNEEQKNLAEKSKLKLEEQKIFDKKIVTPILAYKNFYKAEDYHQDYYKKNPIRYGYYRKGSGRDKFLDSVWKK